MVVIDICMDMDIDSDIYTHNKILFSYWKVGNPPIWQQGWILRAIPHLFNWNKWDRERQLLYDLTGRL